ncbi:MAG: (deoxy)nucleoside triphosphate pyrophosphohydrolase, partial [Candidatus Aminicenantes bacterium]|nr:(deoxy)nucleoside triphosphate pyrophosphohydrolase [Candidatus Aminicenantes bacterium]
ACLKCPIIDFCSSYVKGEQEIIPIPKKKASVKIEAVVGIIRNAEKFLIQKRPAHGLLADLWEFPGGKRKPGETLIQTLHREIKEELNRGVKEENYLITVDHAYTHFRVKLHAFECVLADYPDSEDSKNIKWVSLKEMRSFPFPSGSVKIIRHLEKIYSDQPV